MKVLKKNQLAILVIALMLVTAGYLNYTAKENSIPISGNAVDGKQIAAIGDATLVNSGELLEEKDKQQILNTLNTASSQNTTENTTTNTVETNATKTDTTSDNYYAASKIERDKMYSQMLESYQKILESNMIGAEQKAISQQEINKINQNKNAIMIAENLILTKGFKDCVIFVNDASVSIVVKSENLEAEQIAQIQNVISRELKVELENIHISNK